MANDSASTPVDTKLATLFTAEKSLETSAFISLSKVNYE